MKKLLLLICAVAVTSAGGEPVRSVKFREVLWGVARKAGYSPESGNFLSNQAIPIGEYISQWIERLWAAEDWPELVHILAATPDQNHIVPYDALNPAPSATQSQYHIGRVIAVYLVDPGTTNVPITTKFTLKDSGIHCGFEHGTNVWIKYMEPAPTFTAIPWVANTSYANGDVVYSPNTGDCYKSRVDYNIGHDPSAIVTEPPPNQVPTQDQQPFVPASLGTQAQNKTIVINVKTMVDGTIAADPPAVGALFTIPVMQSDSTLITTATHATVGAETLAAVVTDLATQLTGGLGGGWTVTPDTTALTITISHASDFIVVNNRGSSDAPTYFATGADSAHIMVNTQTSPYVPATSSSVVTQQVTKVTFSQIIPGSVYSLTFVDVNGVSHLIQYNSAASDSAQDIMTGILGAVQGAGVGDPFVAAISSSLDLTTNSITFAANAQVGVNASFTSTASPYWEVVPFPVILENGVIRGATADLLNEWGQSDKAAMEEGKIPLGNEHDHMTDDIDPTLTATYTTQQRAFSRYKY